MVRTNWLRANRVRSIFFACLFQGGGERLRKYGIEENYRVASRIGRKNSGEALFTETTQKRPLQFRKLEDFLKEYHPSV